MVLCGEPGSSLLSLLLLAGNSCWWRMGSSCSGVGWTRAALMSDKSWCCLLSAWFFHGCCYKAKGKLGQCCAALRSKRSAGEAETPLPSVTAVQMPEHQVSLFLVCSVLSAPTSRAILTTLDFSAVALTLQFHCMVSSSHMPNPFPLYLQVSWIPQTGCRRKNQGAS